MPAYTYECETCGDVFDIRRSMTDESPVVCTVLSQQARAPHLPRAGHGWRLLVRQQRFAARV